MIFVDDAVFQILRDCSLVPAIFIFNIPLPPKMRGLTYVLRNKLYIALTNQCISASPLQLRGPSFQLPASANFHPLEAEPSSDEVFKAVDDAFTNGLIGVSSMDSDVITFAGIGEPLLRLDTLHQASTQIFEHRHGAQLRVKTNGLISLKFGSKVCVRARFLCLLHFFLCCSIPRSILFIHSFRLQRRLQSRG